MQFSLQTVRHADDMPTVADPQLYEIESTAI